MKRLATIVALAWLGSAGFAHADEVTLLFATSTPPNTHISLRVFHPWVDRINEQGKGVLRLHIRDGMTIANPSNLEYARVQEDVIQIGSGSHNSVPGTFPLSGFSNMPFQTERSEDFSVAFWRLYKRGLFDAEYKDVVPLFMQIYPQSQIHLAKTPKSPEDISGLRLMVVAKTGGEVVTKLGGGADFAAVARSLRRATAQHGRRSAAVLDGVPAVQARGGDDLPHRHAARHRAGDGLHGEGSGTWLLPAEVRKIFHANSGEAQSRALGKAWDEVEEEARQAAKNDPKHTVIVPPSDALTAKWQTTCRASHRGLGASRRPAATRCSPLSTRP